MQLVDPDDLPDGLTVTDNGDGTATVNGTPIVAGSATVVLSSATSPIGTTRRCRR